MQAAQSDQPRVRPRRHFGKGRFRLVAVAGKLRRLRFQQQGQGLVGQVFVRLGRGTAQLALNDNPAARTYQQALEHQSYPYALMLHHLHLKNVGPAPEMRLDLGSRLNLITGDNGLGKSFLLDVAWWALTRRWPHELNRRMTSGYTARPTDLRRPASIDFALTSKSSSTDGNVIDGLDQGRAGVHRA